MTRLSHDGLMPRPSPAEEGGGNRQETTLQYQRGDKTDMIKETTDRAPFLVFPPVIKSRVYAEYLRTALHTNSSPPRFTAALGRGPK